MLNSLVGSLMKALTDKTLEPKPVALLQQGVVFLATVKGLSGRERSSCSQQ